MLLKGICSELISPANPSASMVDLWTLNLEAVKIQLSYILNEGIEAF